MKTIIITFMAFFVTGFTIAQTVLDYNDSKRKIIVDSLNKEYVNVQTNKEIIKQLFEWPDGFSLPVGQMHQVMCRDIVDNNIEANFNHLQMDFYIAPNGNIDYVICKLTPFKGKTITEKDIKYVKDFFSKNHTTDIKSKKKFMFNMAWMFSSNLKTRLKKK